MLRTVKRFVPAAVCALSLSSWAQVPWVTETPPVPSARAGGVAIAASSVDGGPMVVVGTDNNVGGSFVYDLSGSLDFQLFTGPARNASAAVVGVGGVSYRLTAVAATNIGAVYLFDNYSFGLVATVPVALVDNAQLVPMPRGDAMLVTSDLGQVLQTWTLSTDGGVFGAVRGPDIALGAVVRGLAVDERTGQVYVSLLNQGFARVTLTNGLVEPLGFDGGLAEGIAFYPLPGGGGLLLAAEPPLSDVAVYSVVSGPGLQALTTFTLTQGSTTVRGQRYLAVTQAELPGFPAGMLVVEDDANVIGANYKLVDWQTLAGATTPHLPVVVGGLMLFDAGTPGPDDGGAGGAGGSTGGVLPHGNGIPGDPPKPNCSCAAPGPLSGLALGLWLVWRRRARR